MAVLGGNGGQILRFWFRDPQKALPCAEPRRLTYFASKSVRASWLQPFSRTPPKKVAESLWGAKSRMRRTETPKPIWIKFCTVVDIPDVVKCENFGDHRLRGFWVAGGQISPFPIDFHRRPYNTLALPCECVIIPVRTNAQSWRATDFCGRFVIIEWYFRLSNHE